MRNLVHLLQCVAIIVCGTCAVMVGTSVACYSHPNTTVTQPHTPISDTDSLQLDICKRLLSECVDANILDAYGTDMFYQITKHPSVSRYMELIDECEVEDNFYDTVGSGDTWREYGEYVLAPRAK